MATLDSVFKKVFGEGLTPHGFVKIKGRYPYYVRLVGDEIIHVISYEKIGRYPHGYGAVRILCGVATVYRQRINLQEKVYWLETMEWVYGHINLYNYDKELWKSVSKFEYQDSTMEDVLKNACEITKEIILPILNDVIDIDSCMDFFTKLDKQHMSLTFQYNKENFVKKPVLAASDEGLLWVRLNDRDTYMKKGEESIARQLRLFSYWITEGNIPNAQEQYDDYSKKAPEKMRERMAAYDKIFADRSWLTKAHEELERRKAANTEALRSYGLPL